MGIDHEGAALPVVGEKYVAMELTVVEGIFHEPEEPSGPAAILGNDVVDAFIVVKTLGEQVCDEWAVFGLGFEHNGIKLN